MQAADEGHEDSSATKLVTGRHVGRELADGAGDLQSSRPGPPAPPDPSRATHSARTRGEARIARGAAECKPAHLLPPEAERR